MTSPVERMAARLPTLYREGELVQDLLNVFALQLSILEEEALLVQRSHWFDSAPQRDDIVRLAALLDLEPEPFHTTRRGDREVLDGPLFRAWVHALRRALLEDGSFTPRAIRGFVQRFTPEFERRLMFTLPYPVRRWTDRPAIDRPALVEQVPVRRRLTVTLPGGIGIEPLHRCTVRHLGSASAPVAMVFTGLPGDSEVTPAVVNLSTGRGVVYLGRIETGRRLWLVPRGDRLTARLEGHDVSERLRSLDDVEPGRAWTLADLRQPALPLEFRRGDNELWFLPVAHLDAPALGRALLQLPGTDLQQGRFDGTRFDRSLFHLPPATQLRMGWTDATPASFDVTLPAWALRHAPDRLAPAIESRDRLQESLERSVERLRAAGVRSRVRLLSLTEQQPSRERLVPRGTLSLRDAGATGRDGRPRADGAFDVTDFDDSNWS